MATSNGPDIRGNHSNNLIASKALSEWLRIFKPCILDETGYVMFVELAQSGLAKVYRFGDCWVFMTVNPNTVWGCVGTDIQQALTILLRHFPQFIFPTQRPGMPRILRRVATVRAVGDKGLYHVIRKHGAAAQSKHNVSIDQ